MLPQPYYQDSAVTIYYGDSRQIMPFLGKFDLLLTDPPYGIGESNKKNLSRGKLAKSRDYGDYQWDSQCVDGWLIELMRSICEKQIIFGGNFYPLPPASCWLIWDKENGENDFADCELAWTNLKKAMRIKRHQWNGMLRKEKEERYHPTQKPLDVIMWAIFHAEPATTILDPFAGVGTTGRAAKDLGKKATLIEREERYCEVAAKRMAQEVFDFDP